MHQCFGFWKVLLVLAGDASLLEAALFCFDCQRNTSSNPMGSVQAFGAEPDSPAAVALL